jgi:hypothetical protein
MQLNKNDAAVNIKNRSLMQKYYAWASKQKSPLTARSINHVLQSKKKCRKAIWIMTFQASAVQSKAI